MLCYIYYIYNMKSSFPKRSKRHSRKRACNANAKFKDCVLVKTFSHMYIWVYIYICMKSTFPKDYLRTWHWHCNIEFSIGD